MFTWCAQVTGARFTQYGTEHEVTCNIVAVLVGRVQDELAGGYRKMWRVATDWDHIVDGLHQAGLSR